MFDDSVYRRGFVKLVGAIAGFGSLVAGTASGKVGIDGKDGKDEGDEKEGKDTKEGKGEKDEKGGRDEKEGEDGSEEEETEEDPVDGDGDRIECGETIRGELTQDDESGFRGEDHYFDTYRFDGSEGDIVTVSMTGADEENDDPYLYLLDPDGAIIDANDDRDDVDLNSLISTRRLDVDGEYTIVATSFAERSFFEYELSLGCLPADFDMEPIECGETISGKLTEDDPSGFRDADTAFDVYRYESSGNDLVTITHIVPNPDGIPDLGRPYIYVLNASGEIVAQESQRSSRSDLPGDPRIAHITTLLAPGEHRIVATSLSPEKFFDYELSLECRELEATAIECGETIEGALTRDDLAGLRSELEFGTRFRGEDSYFDTYRFEGTEGEWVSISLIPEDAGSRNFSTTPSLYLLNQDAKLVAQDGRNLLPPPSRNLIHRLGETGEYTIVATSFTAEDFFDYELSLACSEEDPRIGETDTIECGETIEAEITEDDATGFRGFNFYHDAYTFDGEEGETVTIEMVSSDGDDGTVFLLDPDSTVLAEAEESADGEEALIEAYSLEADGQYTIVATSDGSNNFFEYTISVECGVEDE